MLLRIAEDTGQRPPAFDSKPELSDIQRYYVDCYAELSKCRRYTDSGPLPLSVAEIRDYFTAFDLIDFDNFFGWMKQIDDIWLEEVSKKIKKAQTKPVQVKQTAPTPKAPG